MTEFIESVEALCAGEPERRRPGRPVTGKAKTQAQIQREYRLRVNERKASQPSPLDDRGRLLLVWSGLLDLAESLEGDARRQAVELADLIRPVP